MSLYKKRAAQRRAVLLHFKVEESCKEVQISLHGCCKQNCSEFSLNWLLAEIRQCWCVCACFVIKSHERNMKHLAICQMTNARCQR